MDHKIVTYSLSRAKNSVCAIPFIDKLYDLVRDERLGFPVMLVVRANPLDDPEMVRRLADRPFLRLQFPSGIVDAKGTNWRPSISESADRLSTLAHSDVMVMIQSTMILDASLMDRPIINLAYDANLPADEWYSVTRIFRFNHAQIYQRLGATWMVLSDEELEAALRGYLANPVLHRENRARLVEAVVPFRDGMIYKRWADFVVNEAQKRSMRRRA